MMLPFFLFRAIFGYVILAFISSFWRGWGSFFFARVVEIPPPPPECGPYSPPVVPSGRVDSSRPAPLHAVDSCRRSDDGRPRRVVYVRADRIQGGKTSRGPLYARRRVSSYQAGGLQLNNTTKYMIINAKTLYFVLYNLA